MFPLVTDSVTVNVTLWPFSYFTQHFMLYYQIASYIVKRELFNWHLSPCFQSQVGTGIGVSSAGGGLMSYAPILLWIAVFILTVIPVLKKTMALF